MDTFYLLYFRITHATERTSIPCANTATKYNCGQDWKKKVNYFWLVKNNNGQYVLPNTIGIVVPAK